MRLVRSIFFSALALLLSGCGYVHFGRAPERSTALGDARAAEAFTNLATEHKILKQELVLARRETDTLRAALERTGSAPLGGHSADLAARLNETAAELATLRASYAQLQSARAAGTPVAPGPQRDLEEKLATALREQTQLQAENNRLRSEIDRARVENSTLAEKLTLAVTGYDQAQSALAQLNTELVAQKEARDSAERSSEALRAQLSVVMAQSASTGASALQIARAPSAGASSTAELRINTEKIRPTPTPTPAPPAALAPRKHTVRAGDTLELISERYYGAPHRWRTIYEANAALLVGGGALRVGTELTIP